LIPASAKTASEALRQYRERNSAELYFDDEKNLPDLRCLKNHDAQTVTTPASAQQPVFDIFGIPYISKGKDSKKGKGNIILSQGNQE